MKMENMETPGRPPDFIAFGITLVMTCVLALGASKSVLFNNVLNTVNLASWVFILTAGMFYVDTATWTEHEGFLPYGWSGVSVSDGCESRRVVGLVKLVE